VVINIERTNFNRKIGLTFQALISNGKTRQKIEHKYFKDKDHFKSYYNTYIYQDKIISWINPIMMDKRRT
jgi:hypothetical protein